MILRQQIKISPVIWSVMLLMLVGLVLAGCDLIQQLGNQAPPTNPSTVSEHGLVTEPTNPETQLPPVPTEPTETQIPMETIQAFPTVPPGVLKEQLYQGIQGTVMTGLEEGICVEHLPEPGTELPVIVPLGRNETVGMQETLQFCIYGFPLDQQVYISVNAPDGNFMGDGLFMVDSGEIENGVRLLNDESGNWVWSGDAVILEGIPTVRLLLWMPAGLPYGSWKMVLFTTESSVEDTFENPAAEHMQISTMPEDEIDLMPPYPCSTFKPGESVLIYGAGFDTELTLPLGVYLDTGNGELTLVDSLMVSSDESGDFSAWLEVKETYPEGLYSIVPIQAVEEGVIQLVDATGCFKVEGSSGVIESTDEPEGIWEPCPGYHVSQLHVGDYAIVNVESDLPNRVRSAPNRESAVLGVIAPGETMFILDGPECANGWVWWYVSAEDQQLQGWTSEGDHFEYWIMPLP
jgi:hypothetical protein